MWVKIEVVHHDQKMIYLPAAQAKDCGPAPAVKFGGKSTIAGVQTQDDLEEAGENSFETPGRIKLTDKLQAELHMPEAPVYQVHLHNSRISFGPVIGLLLGNATGRYNPLHMMKYSDRFGVYPQVGGLIYAFSPKFINWRDLSAYGLYYNYDAALWEYGLFPLPEVIYRRDFHTDPNQIKRLEESTQGKLFNSYRFSKYELYDFIKLNNELKQHLPPTEYSDDFDQIRKFIHRHHKVILKPIDLSRGRGICVVEKNNEKYKIVDLRSKHPIIYELYNDELLENFFGVYPDFFNNYLIQKYLPLAQIGNAPFDIRVVMQKGPDQEWGCTGIECRVSKNGYLTNISRGGFALGLEEALQQAFPLEHADLPGRLHQLCWKFCSYMDTAGEHFAEFGLDIAIDTDRNLWIIEANVFPSFKGFKKMDLDTYLSIRYTPLLYAASLTSFGAP
ncbi:MAG TPA: YheC/YheD family protein [Bacillota bacterium]|nr:YheC/YheD family protein [Bacillota bacterium]